jgi:hypothetical protein
MSRVDEKHAARAEIGRRFRADEGKLVLKLPEARAWVGPAFLLLGVAYVLVGGSAAELSGKDARLGIAASEGFGPLGQVYGHWRPDVWPLPAAISRLVFLLGEPGKPESGAVLWPSAVAGLIAGWLVARRFIATGRTAAALLFGFAWFGSTALLDHAGSRGFDFMSGLATIAALDRLLSRRSDWVAGLLASAAFLCGGWPPLLVIALAVLVVGRRDADFSFKLIAPAVITATAWFFWTIETASAEAAAAAVVWPLTQGLSWSPPTSALGWIAAITMPVDQGAAWAVPFKILVAGLPLAPFALLLFGRSAREGLKSDGGLALDWARVALAATICGVVVPGAASAAALPALLGLLLASAVALEAAWSNRLADGERRAFFAMATAMAVAWTSLTVYGTYILTIVFTYYRPIGVVLAIAGAGVVATLWRAFETHSLRRGVVAMLLMTACLKLAHAGFYVPEWNYRYGQGPWGRAIGQWLLPHWTLHTQHEWPEDLMWAVGRPVRLLNSPRHLAFPETGESRHVLLLESEFDNWPDSAPRLIEVARFEPPMPFGNRRILARTEGTLTTPSGRLVSRVPVPR